ncbi:hypothetical protein GCM10010232_47820 [Streptomyces amakusaensis]
MTVSSWPEGQTAGSEDWAIGRFTSKVSPQLRQRKSYRGMPSGYALRAELSLGRGGLLTASGGTAYTPAAPRSSLIRSTTRAASARTASFSVRNCQ